MSRFVGRVRPAAPGSGNVRRREVRTLPAPPVIGRATARRLADHPLAPIGLIPGAKPTPPLGRQRDGRGRVSLGTIGRQDRKLEIARDGRILLDGVLDALTQSKNNELGGFYLLQSSINSAQVCSPGSR